MNDFETVESLDMRYSEPLAKYTAARLGGPADVLAIAHNNDALLQAIEIAHQLDMPWLILGGGTNILVSDQGFRGLVLINHAKNVEIKDATGYVITDAGVNLSTLARRCMARGLKGMEWCVSVPGTVGGAVVNNAGAHGSDIAQNLVSATIVDTSLQRFVLEAWPKSALKYDYRYSILKANHGRYLVLGAHLQLEPGHDPTSLKTTADGFVAHRKQTQPPGASLGSIFKNPPGDYAGRLIEIAGLKGYRIGGVQVSPLHGNFFINDEHGTATQYSQLIDYVRETVLEKTGVILEIEIERIGEGF